MMSQFKIGYTTWQQPDIEVMPTVSDVRPRAGASMALALEGSETAYPSYGAGQARLPPLDSVAAGTRWIDVFNRGTEAFDFTATAKESWLRIAPASGKVSQSSRLQVGIDWDALPAGESVGSIAVKYSTGETIDVQVPVLRRDAPPRGFKGHIESDRHVAIEAPHFSRAVNDAGAKWQVLPDFGRTFGAVTTSPVLAPTQRPNAKSAHLQYDVYLFSSGEVKVEWQFAPSLDFQSGDGLQFAVSFDDEPPQTLKLGTWDPQQNWERAVADGVRRVASTHRIDQPGKHVLKFWRVTPGVVLQRIVIDAGGVRPSYLGPPESPRAGTH